MKAIDKVLKRFGLVRKSSTWGDLWKIARENKLFGDKVNEPFKQVPNVYKSIKAIADNVPQAKLKIYSKRNDEEQEDNKLLELIDNPNPLMSYSDFIQAVAGFYALYGETKIIKTETQGSQGTKLPGGLWPVKPSILKAQYTQNKFPPELAYWKSGKERWDIEEVIFARDFNPNSYFSGVRPTDPIEKIIDIDWKGLCFNSAFFENSATLGLALSTDKTLSADQRQRLEKWVSQHYKGHTKAFRTIVLEAGLEAKQIGSTHKDMDFVEQLKYTREETLGVWRVPKALFNITDDLNYACIVEGERVYTANGGAKKVEEVLPGDKVYTLGKGEMVTRKVIDSWKQGVKESYALKTNNREIKTSYDHPILCLQREFTTFHKYPFYKGEGKLVYKKMEDIERGDFVVVGDKCGNGKECKYSAEFAEFVGAFIGDGCFQGNGRSVSFAIPETQPELRERYSKIAQKEFNYKKSNFRKKRFKCSYSENAIHFAGDVAEKLKQAGCIQGSHNKRVPEWVYCASREVKLAFLRGYADTDGSLMKRGNLVFACCNKDLTYDLVSLCDYLGLRRTNIAEERRVTNYTGEEGALVYRFSITYPADIACCKNGDRLLPKGDNGYYVNRLTTALDVLPEGFHVEKVKNKVNIGDKVVYDLEVEDRHNFLCNGVVVHNTFVGQMKMFWLYGLMPILRKVEDVFNKDLIQPYSPDLYCKFDISQVPAFKEDFEKKVKQAKDLFAIGVPLNEIIKKLDLPFDEVEGGEVGYVPFNLMPMGSAGKVEQQDTGKQITAKDDKGGRDGLIWKSFLNRHMVLENRFKSAVSRFFYEQRSRVLEQVNQKSAETINIDINWGSENEELQKRARPYLLSGIVSGIDFGREMLQQEVEEQILQHKTRNLLANGTRTITRINDTVREQTEKELAEAIKAGESVQQASDRIRGVYNNATTRTKTIARTEMTKALNGGNDLYANEAGADHKRWVTAGDEHVRSSHSYLGRQKAIRTNETFSNGLLYPGDIQGSAGEVINCRCTCEYLFKKGE